jgi:general stress protein 26
MDETLKANIIDLLAHHNVMMLATVRPDGFPQATIVYYVNDGLVLYFATDPTSQKVSNIQLNKKVSVAIADEIDNSYKLRALSLSGIAERIIRLLDSHRSVASRRPF